MIDFRATLDPAGGLAEHSEALPPAPPDDLLWRFLVRLRSTAAEHAGHTLTPRVVGAYGHSRSNTLVRGVGEAVERYALFPEGGPPPGTVTAATAADLGTRAPDFADPGLALGAPEARSLPLTWYPARRLRDGADVCVPAPLVDYPDPSPQAAHFDPTPSGAASGAGPGDALRAALLEIVERDAFLTAWEARLRPHRLRPPGPAASGTARPGTAGARAGARMRELRALWGKVERAGLTPVLAELPTGLPGVVCTVGIVLDERRPVPLATVGCNATADDDQAAWSMLGALQEALQVRSVVLNSWSEEQRAEDVTGRPIRDDDDRLRYVASAQGHARVREWVDSFAAERPPRTAPPVSADELVRLLVADGADPLLVDLTYRLPRPLRRMGWCAVKVVPAGYQALRLREDHPFTWHARRLTTAPARTGLGTLAASRFAWRPHPLP
ncbi:YcaO-like family protein [Streptomyces sp. WMMC897]|uniref:YcaO-like family protein n=1 Tax=Streptomyces sp. WMMC897 TaxID=3014782 RepID=UPI0022B68BA2|nr:YcaO-like family protein [Streptomyces sp. WMMC897]MCZ7417074.1 YcaO-like family protein [Streptomyces sp. WMMC897]